MMFGALGKSALDTSITFVSQAALDLDIGKRLGLQRPLVAVKGTRTVQKKDLLLNDYQPVMTVDPQTYEVRADGLLLTCEPAKVLPLAQRYFLF
jgi:urease subunit alpha